MNEFEKELDEMTQQMENEEESKEVPLPSLAEQKEIVKKLKMLEEKGELTDEALAEHFSKFNAQNVKPIH